MNLFKTILKDRSLKPMLSFVLFVLVLVLLYLVYGRTLREGAGGFNFFRSNKRNKQPKTSSGGGINWHFWKRSSPKLPKSPIGRPPVPPGSMPGFRLPDNFGIGRNKVESQTKTVFERRRHELLPQLRIDIPPGSTGSPRSTLGSPLDSESPLDSGFSNISPTNNTSFV